MRRHGYEQMKRLIWQMVKFGGVGAVCTAIDFACLYALREFMGVDVLVASGLAFAISVVVNYCLSVRFVFNVDESKSKLRNFVLFIIFSVIGLVLTEIIMYVGAELLVVNYLLVKVISTVIVMVFNFVTRKMFLER